jgi:hypothetical protein
MAMIQRFPRTFGTAALAGCLSLALLPVLADEAPFPSGTYSLEGPKVNLAFNDKAEFRVTEGTVTQVVGRYEVEEGQLKFTGLRGPWACTQADRRTGTYRWTYVNSVLTLSKVADLCEDRVQSLTSASWTRQH